VTGSKILPKDIRPSGHLFSSSGTTLLRRSTIYCGERIIPFYGLKASDTVVTRASTQHLLLRLLNKLIYMGNTNLLFGWSSNVLTSVTLYKQMAFIAENDFPPLFFCPIFCAHFYRFSFIAFVKSCFFTALLAFRPTAMGHMRTVEELI